MENNQTLLGESALMLDLTDHIARAAAMNKPVLIIGERGTGKELVAARLHYLSQRWDQSFIKINCATMNDNLLESELFGHESGAFTGASKRRIGRFERAEGGSLFLDELGTCSLPTQEKLLRVVEYGEFERLGGQTTLNSDVRLIAATNADLPLLAEKGEFRPDLLDRLAFDVIHIPPLRYRGSDIELLANHYAQRMCLELGREYFAGFTEHALETLNKHPWPGNVRELKNVIERSVYRHDRPEQAIHDLSVNPFNPPWKTQQSTVTTPVTNTTPLHSTNPKTAKADNTENQSVIPSEPIALSSHIKAQELSVIESTLKQYHFNQRLTAQALGLTYHQLRGQLKKHGMLPLRTYKAALMDKSVN